LVYIY